MHYLVMLLFGGLTRFVPAMISRVLVSCGLGIFVAGSLTALLSAITDHMMQEFHGMPAQALALAQMYGVNAGLSIVLAAFTIRVAWDATAVTIRKI